MFFEKKDEDLAKKYHDKIVVGLDFAEEYSQISYTRVAEAKPKTLSLVMGQEEYCISNILGKKYGSDSWLFGKEAEKSCDEGECSVVKDLFFLAGKGMPVILDDIEYDIGEVVGQYFKKCFSYITEITSPEKLEAVVISTRNLTATMVETLEKAIKVLPYTRTKFYFSTYQESMFQYVLHQDKALWIQDVVLFDYGEDYLKAFYMYMNPNTTPTVTLIESYQFPSMPKLRIMDRSDKSIQMQKLDQGFVAAARQICDEKTVSSVFLVGEGFSGNWGKESLRYLCTDRRVFQGNNLYSKGACYYALEKLVSSQLLQSYVYLAEDKIKANLGIRVMQDAEEKYISLLDAGFSWYDAKKTCDIILENENKLPIIITPLDGKNIKVAEIVLEGLTIHGKKTNRIRLTLQMRSVKTVSVTIKDMGFGEFFPSSGQTWKEEFDIE